MIWPTTSRMPAVVVDSSVLITLAAGGQFHLLREFYTTLYVPPEVWHEVTDAPKAYGTNETRDAREAGWLIILTPVSLTPVQALPFNLQPGETEALALAVELTDALLLVDDAQGRRAARALGIHYTGTLGVLLRAKSEGKRVHLDTVLGRASSLRARRGEASASSNRFLHCQARRARSDAPYHVPVLRTVFGCTQANLPRSVRCSRSCSHAPRSGWAKKSARLRLPRRVRPEWGETYSLEPTLLTQEARAMRASQAQPSGQGRMLARLASLRAKVGRQSLPHPCAGRRRGICLVVHRAAIPAQPSSLLELPHFRLLPPFSAGSAVPAVLGVAQPKKESGHVGAKWDRAVQFDRGTKPRPSHVIRRLQNKVGIVPGQHDAFPCASHV